MQPSPAQSANEPNQAPGVEGNVWSDQLSTMHPHTQQRGLVWRSPRGTPPLPWAAASKPDGDAGLSWQVGMASAVGQGAPRRVGGTRRCTECRGSGHHSGGWGCRKYRGVRAPAQACQGPRVRVHPTHRGVAEEVGRVFGCPKHTTQQTCSCKRGSRSPLAPSVTRAVQRSRRGRDHRRSACMSACSTGSRAASPTAALPTRQTAPLRCTSPGPRGSRAAVPTAALLGGRPVLLRCTSYSPKGSRAAAPTGAAPGGRASLPSGL